MTDLVELPMFPLGTVLFPGMPLPLRVFEPRYVQMMRDVLADDPGEFGVVLIERGHEVGGGDHRFNTGTIAQVVQVGAGEGFLSVLTVGSRRFNVVQWLPDDPYPRARVQILDDLTWDEAYLEQLDAVELRVRAVNAELERVGKARLAGALNLSADPTEAMWQLAAIAPITEVDQLSLLSSRSVPALLSDIEHHTMSAATLWLDGDTI